jgi:Zn-dependent M28 family amino/carboxypeptidase
MTKSFILRAAVLALAAGCSAGCTNMNANLGDNRAAANYPAELRPAVESVTAADLLRHITKLSSDEFEGRLPGSKGEELTVAYLTSEFQRLGLKPGNPDGTYVQKVPLAGFKADPALSFTAGGRQLSYNFPDDYVAVSRRLVPETKVENSGVVFVGYGVVAPEYGWDDYKGLDVHGKTVVMLVNDPPVPDPNDSTKLDPNVFKGSAMTYYGRWTYKYEEATRHGAAAAFIVHETVPAGYGYEVVKGSRSQENFDIQTPDNNASFVGVEGWLTLDRAKELLSAAGQDFDALKAAAARKDFKPVELNATANITLKNTLRDIDSQNVVAKIEGSDPNLKNEYVIYTAHWDHLGRNETLQGDQIFNGARDNASGTAALLELAEAYTKLATPPKRSILFLAVTAEEKNLLGAKYYATHPLYPLEKTLADINMDELNVWGRTKDVTVVGLGNSTLDDVAREAAALQGRTLRPDPQPEKGFFYRSDHFEFAKQGVPALYTNSGVEFVGRPEGFGEQKLKEYDDQFYHKPSDDVKPDWDLSGAVEDVQLLFLVGQRVAQADRFPEWSPGTEFKAKRDQMLQKQ